MIYSAFFSSDTPLEDKAWQEIFTQKLRNQQNNSFHKIL